MYNMYITRPFLQKSKWTPITLIQITTSYIVLKWVCLYSLNLSYNTNWIFNPEPVLLARRAHMRCKITTIHTNSDFKLNTTYVYSFGKCHQHLWRKDQHRNMCLHPCLQPDYHQHNQLVQWNILHEIHKVLW